MDALLLSASEASLGQHTLALRVVLAAALAFSAAIVPAPVTATAAEQQQTRTIRVGYLLDNQGFEFGSPDTYMSGWGYEYLQDLSYHAKGLDYDDPQWDKLLDQVTLDEMKILVGNAGWMTTGVKSVEKPALVECDGPNGVNNIIGQVNGTQLVGQSNLGYTWNTELAARVGELFAQEAKALNTAGLYAPAANTHRTAFGGRNYEYVSEDGLLTGKIVAAEAKAIQGQGVYCYLKHFAVNDQETHRADSGGLVTWLNEQSLREIYLRPFEICVKEAGNTGMMSSYNRIGATPVAESKELLTDVLRGEWGFKGAVITDCTMAAGTSDVNYSVRAGNDINLNYLQDTAMTADTTDTAAGHQALRRATKNVLYMVANSDALESTHNLDMPGTIRTGCIVFDVVVIALFGLHLWRRHVKMVRWREAGKPAGRIATWIADLKSRKA